MNSRTSPFSYLIVLAPALAYFSHVLSPQSFEAAVVSLVSILAMLLAIAYAVFQKNLLHVQMWNLSLCLLFGFAGVLIASQLLSMSFAHSLKGVAFDMTSSCFLLTAVIYTYVVSGAPLSVRRVTAACAGIVLVLLCILPFIGSMQRVRPSFEATSVVESRAYGVSGARALLVGLGPNTFMYAWQRFSPREVAQTAFWSEEFPVGSGLIPTLGIEVGVAASLLLFLAIIAAFVEGVVSAFAAGAAPKERLGRATLSLLLLLALYMVCFFEPSATLVVATLALIGASRVTHPLWFAPARVTFFVSVSLFAIAFAAVCYFCVGATMYLFASAYANKNELLKARTYAEYAYAMSPDTHIARLLTQILRSTVHARGLYNLPEDGTLPLLVKASTYARSATRAESQNAQNWKLLGISLAEEYAFKQNTKLLPEAVLAFDRAAKLAPSDPSVYFFKGQLYILGGDLKKAAEALDLALKLRPSYSEAQELRGAMK